MKPLINLDDLELNDHEHGDTFHAGSAAISAHIGAQRIGARYVVVPPGKRAWPFHAHYANEEMFVVLWGNGTLRYGDKQYPIREGDVIAAPAGGPETAHQIINTSDGDLRYLALSTMQGPDVMLYPDSDKYGVAAGWEPGAGPRDVDFIVFNRESSKVNYWDGEN